MTADDVIMNALIEDFREEVKLYKKRLLEEIELNQRYQYVYEPDYQYERGRYHNNSYDHNNDYKNAINGWLKNMESLMYYECHNGDIYDMVEHIVSAHDVSELTDTGFTYEDRHRKINGEKLETHHYRTLIYILGNALKEVYFKAGLRNLLNQVVEHYSNENTVLQTILDKNNFTKWGSYLLPLEHALFLIRYSMEYHQDYY